MTLITRHKVADKVIDMVADKETDKAMAEMSCLPP